MKKHNKATSGWATSLLTAVLRPGRTARRAARLGVTLLEDRTTPATLHWLGAAGANGNLWSVAANWQEGQAPASGDRLVFDTTTAGFSAAANGFAPSNDLAGLANLSLAINDASAAGNFVIAGNPVGLIAAGGVGITSTVSVGTAAVVNNNLTLAADTTAAVGFGSLTLGGVVSGGFALTAAGGPAGTLTLGAANTYTGGTVLTSGTLAVNTNTSLGTGTLTLAGGTLTPAQSFLKLPNPFTVAAPSTIGGGGFFELDGDGVLGTTLYLDNTGFLTLNGALSGPGGLSEIGFPGSTTLGGTAANTFTGGTTIVFGGITLKKTPGVTALASPVKLTGSFASLTLGANNQLNGTPVSLGLGSTLALGGFSDTVSSLTGLGAIDTSSTAAATLTVTGGGNQLLTGAVSGAGQLKYFGPGSLTLAGASSGYTGTLNAAGGSLLVAADFSGAAAQATGGTLGGTGVVKSVTATSGGVNPGGASAGGTLSTASAAVASSLAGTIFRIDLADRGLGDHLALGANATLNLAGTALAVNPLGATSATTYQIVTSPTGGISGTFNGLPDAATLTAGGQTFRINYTPNAVTLTNLGTGPRVLHWTGAAGSGWGTAGNWAENAVPASGDTLVFDTTAPGFAGTAAAFAPSNNVAGLTDIALVINDASAAGDFAIAGNPVGLVAAGGVGITSTVSVGTAAAVNTALSLAAGTTAAVGLGSLTLGGVVSGGFALTASGSPAGTLTLNAANTYTGGTVLTSGTVAVNTDTSLGSGPLTLAGGTLANAAAFLHVRNPFVVAGPSTIGGGSFFNLDGTGTLNADLRLTNTGFLTLNGALSGPGGLIEDGFPGGTTLGGTAANSYTGPTTIISGSLTLNKPIGVTAVASPISLAGGSFPTLVWGASNQLGTAVTITLGVDSTIKTGGFSDTVAGLSGIGAVDTGLTATAGLTVAGGVANRLTGQVSGSGLLRYTGTGSLTLGGASSSYTGTLTAAGGTLLVSADFSGATAQTQAGGTLGGTGVVKTLLPASTGTLTPGGSGAGGILTTAAGAGPASTLGGQTFRVDLNDAGLSDQLVVGDGATLNLAGATLSVNLLHTSFGSVYPIITSPSGGLTGTFAGLADNATLAVAGRLFRIHYTASAVTLTDLQSVTLTPATLPVGEVGVAYNKSITFTGGTPPVTLSVSGVTNPTGLTIGGNGTGTITVSGTPTAAGTLTFTVTPTDAVGTQAGTTYTVTVNPPVVLTPATLPAGEVGLGYNQTITPTGGTGTVTLSVSGVTNPTGLTIGGSGTGAITVSGTPTAAGTVTFTVTPTDAIGTSLGKVYTVTVNPAVTLVPAALPTGEVGVAYTQTIIPTGGTAPVTLTVSAVTNPTGLTIGGSGTGTITVSGTPTTAGMVTFTVTPSDPAGASPATVYSFAVIPGMVLAPAALPTGEVGLAYTQAITGAGGSGAISLAVSNVTNPTGLTIAILGSDTVSVSGTPTTAGAVTFTVTPTDAIGTGQGKVYTFDVAPPVTLAPATLPAGKVGQAYNRTITAAGGSGAITLALSGVTNPTGLTIGGSGTGAITVTGVPTSAGTVTFTVTPTDAVGPSAGTVYTFNVGPAVVLAPATLPAGEAGVAYHQTITPTGGTGAVTLAVSNVTNPTGLTITGSGTGTITLTGTPTAAGTVTFTVTPTDAIGPSAGTVYTVTVNPPVVLAPATLPAAEVGLGYNRTITPTGGAGAVTLAVSNITNPTGLTISGSGTGVITVSGTPTTAGTVTFTVTPTDAIGTGQGRAYTLVVAPPVVLAPAALPAGEVGLTYNRTITPTGGVAPVTLAVSNVTNPTGLTIAGSGTGTVTVSGTPTAAGTVTFTVTPTDPAGAGAATVYTFAVGPAVTLAPTTLPAGQVGAAYTQAITAAGGSGPVTLAVSNVTNATGLAITGSGTNTVTVSGTPTAAGTVTFTVTPTDAVGAGAGKVYTFAVAPVVVPTSATRFAVAADAGGPSAVTLYKPDGSAAGTFDPFPGYTGGTRVAVADFNGDGVADLAVGTGPGGPTHVRVLDGTDGHQLFAIDPFEASFTGGLFVAAGDLTGDGKADLVITPDEGGGPRARVFSGDGFAQIADFFGIDDPNFRGGARAAVGDVTGDGRGDLVVSAGFGGGPRVAAFDGTSLSNGAFTRKPFGDFFAFESSLSNGVYVAAGDLNGDGFAEIVTGAGPGGGPRVSAFDGKTLVQQNRADRTVDFFAGNTDNRGGVRVAARDLTGDGKADVVTGAGAGGGSGVAAYRGTDQSSTLLAFDAVPGFTGGVFVG